MPADPAFRFQSGYAVASWFNMKTPFNAKFIGVANRNEWGVVFFKPMEIQSRYEHGNDVDDIIGYDFATSPFNQWHHFVAQYNAGFGQHELYVDGVLVQSAAQPAPEITSMAPLEMGTESGLPTFPGLLDEIYIFPGALTQLEIDQLADASSLGGLRVVTSVTGNGSDLDGFTFTIDAGSAVAIGVNASVTICRQAPGLHTLSLGDVATNCVVNNGSSQTATVLSGGTVEVMFDVSCVTS